MSCTGMVSSPTRERSGSGYVHHREISPLSIDGLTIATMPAFRASGRPGHASTTAARSGLSSGAGATTQTRVARRLREGPGTAGLGRDDEIEPSTSDVARIPEISGLARSRRSDSEYRRWESNPHGRSRPEDFKS